MNAGAAREFRPEQKAQAVRAMFSAIAPTYDRLNRILSFGIDGRWRRRLVDRLPQGPIRVLDLACGTGDVSMSVARARSQSRVLGADFSLPMLRGAIPKLARAGLSDRVLLQNASAEDLPYRTGSFDAVTIAFGIRNVARKDQALREMHRVLRPGGIALVLDFSLPHNRAVRAAYGLYFYRLLPLVGGLVSGNFAAYRYLPRSVRDFPSRAGFVALVEAAGFTNVRHEDLTLGIATLYFGWRP